MEYSFNATASPPLNQSLPPISSILQYPHENSTMPYYANQQPFNYNDTQPNAVIQYVEEPVTETAVAVVRAVIAMKKGDKMPHLVNQESAVFSNNSTQNEAAAVEESVAKLIQSAISINQDDTMSYFTNQCSTDFSCNYQNNNGYDNAIIQCNEKEIMSTALAAMQPIPTKNPTIPINPDDFPGELNFQFFINNDESYKKSFVYSKQLGKVFLAMKKPLPVQFSWQSYPSNLRVRAYMIFQDSHSRDKPVQRCFAHKASELPENGRIEQLQLKFTFRTNQRGSMYQEDHTNGFLSIVTPAGLPNPGRDYFQVDYVFFCMTSCVTGINRRATFLVFTLEDENGYVFGRRSLPIQICSCPKRDMEKEEKSIVNPMGKKKLNKNRKIEKVAPYPVSRTQPTINLPKPMSTLPNNGEDEVFDLNLKILGGEEYLSVLNFAVGRILKDAFENNTFDKHRGELDDIRQKIEDYNKRTNASS